MAQVIVRTKTIGKTLSEKGRVRVRFSDGREYSIDASRIKEIYFYGGEYYIRYETDNADFYKQYAVPEIPRLAIRLRHQVKEEKVFVCAICGSEIEWDADEPFCPNFCDERYSNWSYRSEVRRYLIVEPDGDEVQQFAEKLFGVRITEKVAELYRTSAGGFVPLFDLVEIEVELYRARVFGAAVVQDPSFHESHYDEMEVYEHKFQGRYIAVRYWDRDLTAYTALYKFEGEPDLALLKQLHEEYRRKEEKQKERQRKALEEWERRQKEEERRWGDVNRVIDAIRRAVPSWADGAVVVARVIRSMEDADVAYEVYPVKRSQRGQGYYYSPQWRILSTGVPERFLERLADTIILRDGSMVKIKSRKQNGYSKYVTLEV